MSTIKKWLVQFVDLIRGQDNLWLVIGIRASFFWLFFNPWLVNFLAFDTLLAVILVLKQARVD
jgi:hypothetical protein